MLLSAFVVCTMLYSMPYSVRADSAQSAVVIDAATGIALYEKQADLQLSMASTTKIMTALLTLEQEHLDSYFTVDSDAIQVEGSSMGLLVGDSVTYRGLAYGMLLLSGNDAANAAAVQIAGSISAFVELMNQRAAALGMTNTHFVTPSGLDDDAHYSTARDMAILARAALQNPYFAEICSSTTVKISYGNPPYLRTLTNHNKLLTYCDGVIGVKTGFTKKSGRCLVSACTRNGATLICVTLNDSNDWDDHANFYDVYFGEYHTLELALPAESYSVPVVGGTADAVTVIAEGEEEISLPQSVTTLETQVCLPQFCYAPVEAGTVLGEVRYYADSVLVATRPLVAANAVESETSLPKESIWEKLIQFFQRLF